MGPTSLAPRRPRRSDAVRNEHKVRDAARRVFERKGKALTMDDVALEAAVSKGTVYNTFDSREDLLEELTLDYLAASVAAIKAQAGGADAWQGIMDSILTPTLGIAATYDVIDINAPPSRVKTAFLDILMALDMLLDAAKAQGTVRQEITALDVMTLFKGLYAVLPPYGARSIETTQKFAQIILRGIRS